MRGLDEITMGQVGDGKGEQQPRGALLVLAEIAGEAGAGLYLVTIIATQAGV